MHQSSKFHSCPITNDNLGALDINESTIRVGEQTLLYMPSFYDRPKPKKVTSINFDVIQRTYLGSLDEGIYASRKRCIFVFHDYLICYKVLGAFY